MAGLPPRKLRYFSRSVRSNVMCTGQSCESRPVKRDTVSPCWYWEASLAMGSVRNIPSNTRMLCRAPAVTETTSVVSPSTIIIENIKALGGRLLQVAPHSVSEMLGARFYRSADCNPPGHSRACPTRESMTPRAYIKKATPYQRRLVQLFSELTRRGAETPLLSPAF